VSWPEDTAKLERVRALMADEDLDALVVRSPDNVLYLSNYWGMKGYDAVVFPREGRPTLICLDPQLEEAQRMSWTDDILTFGGYDAADPRPPFARTLDLAAGVVEERGFKRIGLELSQGTQASDRMVGEPTTFSLPWFDGFGHTGAEVVDGATVISRARAIKTEQEIERMKLANELAALAYDEVRSKVRESDVQIYAMGIFDPYAATPEERMGPQLLQSLTEESGGRMFQVDDVDELSDIAEKISTELRNQYVIGYKSTDGNRDGKWRKVKVKVNPPPGLPPLTVYARTGYYAPLQ